MLHFGEGIVLHDRIKNGGVSAMGGATSSDFALGTIVITAILTALFTLFATKFGEAILRILLKPFSACWEFLYKRIAPRNPFSIALRTYKRSIERSSLSRIENPVGPSLKVSIARAFAPLKLLSSSTREGVDLFPYVAAHTRCIILGGPGTGKTTLMKSLIMNMLAGTAHEALNDQIPVFIVLRKLAKEEHRVRDAIIAAFERHHFPGADKFVDSALAQGKMLIVLDGLDEVGASRAFVAEAIRSFCEQDEQRSQPNRVRNFWDTRKMQTFDWL